jgi:hypothetical protein
LDTLTNLHIVTGTVLFTTGVPTLTSNDASLTIADTGEGNWIFTWTAPWVAAPVVFASVLKGTHVILELDQIHVSSVTTTTFEVQYQRATTGAAGVTDVAIQDPDDDEGFMILVIGQRNR